MIRYDHDAAGNRTSRYWYCWGASLMEDDSTLVEYAKSLRLLADVALSLFPSPASDNVYFTLTNSLDQANYRVVDLDGRVVRDGTFSGDRGTITVAGLAPGAYHLQVFREDELLSRSFIVE